MKNNPWKTVLKEYVPIALLNIGLRLRSAVRHRKFLAKNQSAIFSEIYRNKSWGGDSVSGMGSDLKQTDSVRNNLVSLLEGHGMNSFLDLPCGDFHWMRFVDLKDRHYIGGDIVRNLIQNNLENYGGEKRRFVVLDVMQDALPDVDVIMCRDCLIHFSNGDVLKALKNIRKSKIIYILTTNYPLLKQNTDIMTGDFRAINLRLSPFNFPPPLTSIPEDPFPEQGSNPNFIRELCLWKIADIF